MRETAKERAYRSRAKVYRGKPAVRTRLNDLDRDLDDEELRECVSFGTSEGSRSTEHEPKTARGTVRWLKTVGAVREKLSKKGWERHDDENYPTIVNAAGTLGITASSGDENTGIEGTKDPESKNPKGPATQRAVEKNVVQGQFHDIAPSFPRLVEEGETRPGIPEEIWILLYREDEENGTTYMELSRPIVTRPVGDSDQCYIIGWSERIILEPIKGQSTPLTPADEEGEAIDVPVERRAN